MATDADIRNMEHDINLLYGKPREDAVGVYSNPLGFLDGAVDADNEKARGYILPFNDAEKLAVDRPAGVWERRVVRRVVEEERDVLALRVSALAGCLRRAHYDISGYEKADEPSAEGWAMRAMGSVLEPIMIERLRREETFTAEGRSTRLWMIEDVQRDVRCLVGDVELQGTIDAIASHPNYGDGKPFVLEVKTRRHAQKEFARVAGVERNSMGGRPAESAHRAAAMQAAVYSMAQDNGDRTRARGVMVATFSRDDASVTLNYIPAPRVLELWNEALERIDALKASIKNQTPPAPEYPAGHKICGECEFRSVCGNHISSENEGVAADILSDDELAQQLIIKLLDNGAVSKEVKAQARDASERIKRHMIASNLTNHKIWYKGRTYSLTLSEIEMRGVNYERFNELVDPDVRQKCDDVRVHYRLNVSSAAGRKQA